MVKGTHTHTIFFGAWGYGMIMGGLELGWGPKRCTSRVGVI